MEDAASLLAPVVDGNRRVLCCHKARLNNQAAPNSLAAVRECVAARVPRIEIDVWVLADGSTVVFHDETLDRDSTGTGPTAALTRETARGLALCDGTPIVSLEPLVDALAGSSTVLQVDLKGFTLIPDGYLEMLAATLEPIASHTLVGSQAHWNTRRLARMGLCVALDTTVEWHVGRGRRGGDLLTPTRQGLYGLWDDSLLAHVPGVRPHEYVAARIDDLLALLPAEEWMVDWRTLFHLADMGCDLGHTLRERGVALAAWTLSDEGEAESLAKLRRLFALGAGTIITDAPLRLAEYLSGI